MLDEPKEPDDGLAALEPPGAISLRAGETVRVAPPVSVPLTEAVSLHTSTTWQADVDAAWLASANVAEVWARLRGFPCA